jgi:LacI family transcriptional regulator
MQPTQYDIARLTGLSQATISRALRGDASVVQDTRDRILAACAELNYRPSIGARLLAEGRRAMIGISLSRDALPTDRYVTLLYQNLVQQLDDSGWGVTLLASTELSARMATVGAVILIGVEHHDPRLDLCKRAKVPFVAIGYVSEADVFSVIPDDADGARQVVAHFHALGRRHFAVMSSFNRGQGPAMGIRAEVAMTEARRLGLTVTHLDALRDITSTLGGYRTAMRFKNDLSRIDCLFCDTDEHALGAAAAIRDLGLRIPQDITVAGFDDLPGLSQHLTTIRQDFAEIARSTIILREEAILGTPARKIVVPVNLILRQT